MAASNDAMISFMSADGIIIDIRGNPGGLGAMAMGMAGWLIAAFSTASIIPYIKDLGLGFVAMFFAVAALLKYKHDVDKLYAAVDWDLLAFFGSLFIVINVMEHAQVLAIIGKGLAAVTDLGPKLGPVALLWCSGIMSSVTDNIPLSAMLAKIFATAPEPPPNTSPLWWAIIFGCNLGGNITPIGSASTVVAVTIIHRNKLPLSFVQFVKSAAPFAAAQHLAIVVGDHLRLQLGRQHYPHRLRLDRRRRHHHPPQQAAAVVRAVRQVRRPLCFCPAPPRLGVRVLLPLLN